MVYICIMNVSHTHTGILSSHEKETNPAICETWTDIKNIMLNEVSQREKGKYCMIPLIYVKSKKSQTCKNRE